MEKIFNPLRLSRVATLVNVFLAFTISHFEKIISKSTLQGIYLSIWERYVVNNHHTLRPNFSAAMRLHVRSIASIVMPSNKFAKSF